MRPSRGCSAWAMEAGLTPTIATFGLNLSEPHSKSDIIQQMSTDPGLSTIKEICGSSR